MIIYFVLTVKYYICNMFSGCSDWELFFMFVLPAGILVVTKLYLLYVETWCECYSCLLGKTAIVTGSNSGMILKDV